jgi:hypothetical protein
VRHQPSVLVGAVRTVGRTDIIRLRKPGDGLIYDETDKPLDRISLYRSPSVALKSMGGEERRCWGCQTRLGLLLALGFREYEDDECRTTCALRHFRVTDD